MKQDLIESNFYKTEMSTLHDIVKEQGNFVICEQEAEDLVKHEHGKGRMMMRSCGSGR